jgi:hypothetical protein
MMNIVIGFSCMKRKERNVKRTPLVESLRELRTEDTDTWAWGENFHFLQETISRLERANTQRRTKMSDWQAEFASLRPDMPTHLAQDILLRFCRADTTELCEAAIFEMCPENRFAVQAALSELCDHNLLTVSQTGHTDKLYVVTTKGQNLCFSCRHEVGV